MLRTISKLTVLFVATVFSGLLVGQSTTNVLMATSEGEIEIELYLEQAPITAGNFLRLVEGGHLDGSTFYRTVTYENDNGSPKIEVIQGGPNQGPGPYPPIAHETTEQTGLLHLDGTLSMSRSEVGTASTEFFICIGDQPGLNYGQPRNADGQGFSAFGKVVRGMDVVRVINSATTDETSYSEYTRGQQISEPVVIESVVRI